MKKKVRRVRRVVKDSPRSCGVGMKWLRWLIRLPILLIIGVILFIPWMIAFAFDQEVAIFLCTPYLIKWRFDDHSLLDDPST